MNKNKNAVIRVILAAGISSVVLQLLIIREFLAQFQGNEFVIALIFFNWLSLNGMGTLLARGLLGRHRQITFSAIGWIALGLTFLPPVQILAIRLLRDVIFIPGSSVGFYPIWAYTFFLMLPYCLLLGFSLPCCLAALRNLQPGFPGAVIYISDNIGDITGGVVFSFVLVYLVSPLQAVFLSSLPLLAASFFVFPAKRQWRPSVLIISSLTGCCLLAGIFFEPLSLNPGTGRLVHYRETPYGRVAVHQNLDQFTLFSNGMPLFSTQSPAMAEQNIHYPLSQLDTPSHVLLISARSGMLTEVEKYHLQSIDYIELDPEVSKVGFKYGFITKIPGLQIIHEDARAYLKKTQKRYDAVIVNLPEPETFQINRFFTTRFFRLAKSRLTDEGVLGFAMTGFENYLAEPQRRKLSSVYNSLAPFFNHVLLMPGQQINFLCRNAPLSSDIPALLAQKQINTRYITSYFYGDITAQRITTLHELMNPSTPINQDLSPSLMRLIFAQWFAKFSTSPVIFIIILALLCSIYLLCLRAEEFVLFSSGWIAMGSEILVIFAFQIFFGYIYLHIGLIVTVFLGGLLPGAWLGTRPGKKRQRLLYLTDAFLIALLGMFILALWQAGDRLPIFFYLVFGFLISMACGFQFPLALFLGGDDTSALTRTFSADLAGAAFGTLFTSVVLIPYCGILEAAGVLILIKTASLIIMKISDKPM